MTSIQTTDSDYRTFHEEADTFNLTVTLTDSQLVLTLKDLVEWAIYEKEYTKNDIGEEIHQKMDLFDVFSAFFQTQGPCDEEDTKETQGLVTRRLKRYAFGTMIEIDGVPCFKIEKGGLVSTYLINIDKKSKKEVTC